jgi:hypothetical protein
MKAMLLSILFFSNIYSMSVPSFKDDSLVGCICSQNMTTIYNPTGNTLYIDSIGVRIDYGIPNLTIRFTTISQIVDPGLGSYYYDSTFYITTDSIMNGRINNFYGGKYNMLEIPPEDSLHFGNMWPEGPLLPTKRAAKKSEATFDTVDIGMMIYLVSKKTVVDSIFYKGIYLNYTGGGNAENAKPSSIPLIKVQPNPISGNASINVICATPTKIRIFNVQGKCIYHSLNPKTANNLNLERLAAGQYIVEATTQTNILRQKITIER